MQAEVRYEGQEVVEMGKGFYSIAWNVSCWHSGGEGVCATGVRNVSKFLAHCLGGNRGLKCMFWWAGLQGI